MLIKVQDLKRKNFLDTLQIQESLRNKVLINNTDNYLILVEHDHVYTLGNNANYNNILKSTCEIIQTQRGGDVTYHGPGQVVGYPILDLENFFTDIHKYLRLLEETIILTLAEYGIKASRSDGETGVWLDVGTPFARKICAMGVRASRWVTMHGFALNVNTDLGYFDNIIPCGIRGKAVTSLRVELYRDRVDENKVKEKLLKHSLALFEANLA